MSDPRFLQDGFDKRLSHFIEECGEALAAAGKTQRWGAWSTNPLLPPAQREANLTWLIRELTDVRQALDRLEECIALEFTGDDVRPVVIQPTQETRPAPTSRPEHVAAHDCACAECVADERRCTCKDYPGADEFCTAHDFGKLPPDTF